MRRLTRITSQAAAASLMGLVLPSAALACAVCMTGKEDDTRIAFGLMTAFMTVVPFVIFGGVLWWLNGRLKEIEAMHERAREGGRAGADRATSPLVAVDSSPR